MIEPSIFFKRRGRKPLYHAVTGCYTPNTHEVRLHTCKDILKIKDYERHIMWVLCHELNHAYQLGEAHRFGFPVMATYNSSRKAREIAESIAWYGLRED